LAGDYRAEEAVQRGDMLIQRLGPCLGRNEQRALRMTVIDHALRRPMVDEVLLRFCQA
jgi:hypothetical protein